VVAVPDLAWRVDVGDAAAVAGAADDLEAVMLKFPHLPDQQLDLCGVVGHGWADMIPALRRGGC
jgi:hypothetical protein